MSKVHVVPLQPASDASAIGWIADRITTFAEDVSSVVPAVFDRYVRIFHPAGRGEPDGQPIRWGDIAEANGHILGPKTVFPSIVPPECFDESRLNWRKGQPGLWDWPPQDGGLPEDLARHLSRVLSTHTSRPDRCHFAYWTGWGDPVVTLPAGQGAKEEAERERVRASYQTEQVYVGTPRQWKDSAPTLSLPGREYYLFEGPIDEVTTDWDGDSDQLPTMWWPGDRGWFVHTEIDFDTTYVGGSQSCIAGLLDDDELEAIEVEAESPLPQL